MSEPRKESLAEQIRGDMYGMETMKWYGWGSPIGIGVGVGILAAGAGVFLWMLHLADIIH